MITVPASADSELTLRRAEQQDLIKYSPGSEQFDIVKPEELNKKTDKTHLISSKKISWENTCEQVFNLQLILQFFKLLKMNAVYPVADENKLSDKKGNILPDLIFTQGRCNR